MTDRSSMIFGNPIRPEDYRKSEKSKQKMIRKYGDDSGLYYPASLKENHVLTERFGLYEVSLGEGVPADSAETGNSAGFDTGKGVIVGNIRMGFGHYRISMAMASAAHALGYTPYWMDLNGYPHTTCTKIISGQNDLYSMGSRLSQKSRLFNKLFWEPMNYEGFRKLTYNSSDQKNAELMAPVYRAVPKDVPVIATHVWPAQAAVHAGMLHVVNAIPDNWPMALHLSEGSLHTIQTHQAYQGYRILNGMQAGDVLRPMPADSLIYTGHYIDHEMTANIESDCAARVARKAEGKPIRFLLTIGGAGAQKEIFAEIIRYLMPAVREGRAALYVNVGDYKTVWEQLKKEIPSLAGGRAASAEGGPELGEPNSVIEHFDNWQETGSFAEAAMTGDVSGVHAFWHPDIFEAVYCTNLLIRSCDVLVTKPSELAFYPVPKLFIKRIGGHEMWGAIHSAEMGDGTLECRDIPHTLQMIQLFLEDETLLKDMCGCICENKKSGLYDGAYKVVELAMGLKNR
ncbi:MAG: hypothetical protein II914_06020 [Clostridia bacterium]|nr:hypothetical protein [Clostridia bacterium]